MIENQHARTTVLILGAGGHAQVVADILLRLNATEQPVNLIGYLDDNPDLHGKVFLGLPVLGGIDALAHIPHEAVIVAVGANQIRRRIANQLAAAGESFISACHPTAILAPDVQFGAGTVICAGVVVNTGAVIGSHVILNTSCSVDHHSRIGDYVHVAPGILDPNVKTTN